MTDLSIEFHKGLWHGQILEFTGQARLPFKPPYFRNPRSEANAFVWHEIERIVVDAPRGNKHALSPPTHTHAEIALIDRFVPSPQLVSEYVSHYNSAGLEKLSMWMMGALLSKDYAGVRLGDAIEDAIISTYAAAEIYGSPTVVIDDDLELVLISELRGRIPRIPAARAPAFLNELLANLKSELAKGKTLLVDGGIVECTTAGTLQVTATEPEEYSDAPNRKSEEVGLMPSSRRRVS